MHPGFATISIGCRIVQSGSENEIMSPEKTEEEIKEVTSARVWTESQRHKSIKSAVEGFRNLFQNSVITDEQLNDAIEMNETVIEYLESRMSGSNIFTAGLVLELRSLKGIEKIRKEFPAPKDGDPAIAVLQDTAAPR